MTTTRYALGVLLAAVVFLPVAGGARSLRRWLLPGWTGSGAFVVDTVFALSIVVVVTEVLGSVAAFRTAPVVVVLAVTGAVTWKVGHRRIATRHVAPRAPADATLGGTAEGVTWTIAMVLAVGAVAAAWGARTIVSYRHGMGGIDTLWYHMPFAARFVQRGSTAHLHYVDADALIPFYPATGSLFHTLGILLFGSDLVSPLLNLMWAGLALVSAWCIGKPYGVPGLTTLACAVVLAFPGIVETQAGSAYTDVPGIAFLLAAVAILVVAEQQSEAFSARAVVPAALAAGLALGTKYQFLLPIAVLVVGVIASRPRRRAVHAATWFAGVALTGGYWYLRNLFAIGNPLPPLGLSIGPLHLPKPRVLFSSDPVTRYLFDGQNWRQYIRPGLHDFYGWLWWLMLAVFALAAVGALQRGTSRVIRVTAVVAVAAMIGYLVTPQNIDLGGRPVFFGFNLRYTLPALALGLVLLPVVATTMSRRRGAAWCAAVALFALLAAEQLDPAVWPVHLRHHAFAAAPTGIDARLGLAMGAVVALVVSLVLVLQHMRTTRLGALFVTGVCLASLFGAALRPYYLHHRYVSSGLPPRLAEWARTAHHARIGFVGSQLQYPLYGEDLSNFVQYIGEHRSHGSYLPIESCRSFRIAINAEHYTYVMTTPKIIFGPPPAELAWTGRDPKARLVLRDGSSAVFRIVGRLDPSGCARLGRAATASAS